MGDKNQYHKMKQVQKEIQVEASLMNCLYKPLNCVVYHYHQTPANGVKLSRSLSLMKE